MLGASSISLVLDAYMPERTALVDLLEGLTDDEWQASTECPAYTVHGVAAHILGDDLSLLSRQRDGAVDGVSLLAPELPDADFRVRLDTFNDRWVATARFLSGRTLTELLHVAGIWTEQYYRSVDPEGPGEPVGLFGAQRGEPSPLWQAIAREYLERWIHHSQIRRALGRSSLAERRFLSPGVEVAAAIAGLEPGIPASPEGTWSMGPLTLGGAQQTADVLTRAHPADVVR
ncbi:MAG TPA: maleylpyruvate isomerase N-terminal domain-containing protein, partial [Acidimicrobiales bacterium]|nr:maleylpyruvate isomerase N-terminal domain-containing protein [Acidimicrobiales bacterium]